MIGGVQARVILREVSGLLLLQAYQIRNILKLIILVEQYNQQVIFRQLVIIIGILVVVIFKQMQIHRERGTGFSLPLHSPKVMYIPTSTLGMFHQELQWLESWNSCSRLF